MRLSLQIMSNVLFVSETLREAKRLAYNGHRVWLYNFEHSTPLFDQLRHVWRHFDPDFRHEMVFHGNDAAFAYMPEFKWPSDQAYIADMKVDIGDELEVSKTMAQLLRKFIKSGELDGLRRCCDDQIQYFLVKGKEEPAVKQFDSCLDTDIAIRERVMVRLKPRLRPSDQLNKSLLALNYPIYRKGNPHQAGERGEAVNIDQKVSYLFFP